LIDEINEFNARVTGRRPSRTGVAAPVTSAGTRAIVASSVKSRHAQDARGDRRLHQRGVGQPLAAVRRELEDDRRRPLACARRHAR
jgi:hypothetical protein